MNRTVSLRASVRQQIEDAGANVLEHWEATYAQFSAVPSAAQLDSLDAVFRDEPDLSLRSYGYGPLDHVDFLARLPSARRVFLDHGPITRWEGLAHLSPALTRLEIGSYAKGVPLEEISRRTNLRALRLRVAPSARELPLLARLTGLTELSLDKVKLPEAVAAPLFTALSKVETLELLHASLPSLSTLRTLSDLRDLTLGALRGVTTLDSLPALPSLARLKIYMSPLVSIDGIQRLQALETLEFGSSPTADLSPISELSTLASLSLFMLKTLASLPELSSLTALKKLYLADHPMLAGLAPVLSAPSLTSLEVRRCKRLGPENFAAISGHPTLRDLKLGLSSMKRNKACEAAFRQ